MKKSFVLFLVLFVGMFFYACKSTQNVGVKNDLSKKDRKFLIAEIETLLETDQQYRRCVSLGTLDEEIIKEDIEKSKTLSIEEYIAFKKTIKDELSQEQKDSLWALQHELDYENYLKIKSLLAKYGYPSRERLGVKESRFFVLLLHPAPRLDPREYRDEMSAIFATEVEAGRMDPQQYASFYDNITYKILKEPMLYGTGKVFDRESGQLKPPFIGDLETSNNAREKIGLPVLKEGEYRIMKVKS